MLSDFTCKSCAMSCRYFTRVECETHGHNLWEPADRFKCESCISWHPGKHCCVRYYEPCAIIARERAEVTH